MNMTAAVRNGLHDTGVVAIVFALFLALYLAVANGFAMPWSPIGVEQSQPFRPQPFTQADPPPVSISA